MLLRLTPNASRITAFKELGDFRKIFAEEGQEAAEIMHANDTEVLSGFLEDIGDGAVACPADAH
jgi:hypothetical protein